MFSFFFMEQEEKGGGEGETKRNEMKGKKKLRTKICSQKKNNNNTIKNFTVSTMWRKWIVWCGRIILGFLKIPTLTLNQLKRELNDVWKLYSLSFLLSRIKQVLIVLFFFSFSVYIFTLVHYYSNFKLIDNYCCYYYCLYQWNWTNCDNINFMILL